MADIDALLADLENAGWVGYPGMPILEGHVARAVGWTHEARGRERCKWWRHPSLPEYARRDEPPQFLRSIDAALTLVPEGFEWSRHRGANGKMTMQVDGPGQLGHQAQGATPALALCIAALRARKAIEAAP